MEPNTRDYSGEEFCSAFSIMSDISKFRDPLHLLLDYIAEVGTILLILRLISTSNMRQASDCGKILVHDEDLLMINGIGHGTVSGLLNSNRIVHLMSAVTGNPQSGRDGGDLPEIRYKDT
jgi:hypothetical protein